MVSALLVIGAALLCVGAIESLQVALGRARQIVLSDWVDAEDAPALSGRVRVSDFTIAGRLLSASLVVVLASGSMRLWEECAVLLGEAPSSLVERALAFLGLIVCLSLLGLAVAVGARLGERFPNQVVQVLSPLGLRLAWFCGPLTRLIRRCSAALVPSHSAVAEVHEEALEADIRTLVEEGEKAGVIEEEEREIITRVFKLGDRPLAALMTPRSDVVFLSIVCSLERALEIALESRLSWFPVLGDSEDEVLGIVSIHDLVSAVREPSPAKRALRELLVKALEVPESMSALDLLEKFREESIHFAVIRDEYGGVAGIATLDDVLRMIVGDVGESGEDEKLIVRRDDGSLLVDASSDVENLFEYLELTERLEGFEGQYHSVGGFVMTSLGRIPKEGDFFEQDGYRFEVVDMDGKRIDKILVARVAGKEAVGQ